MGGATLSEHGTRAETYMEILHQRAGPTAIVPYNPLPRDYGNCLICALFLSHLRALPGC
jgi:hypothetical protein